MVVVAVHEDQFDVSESTVPRFIHEQFPRGRQRAVPKLPTAGTVNAVSRSDLAARFPLRALDPRAPRAWLLTETAAAREVADASTVPTPEPVAIGEPATDTRAVRRPDLAARTCRHGRGPRRFERVRGGRHRDQCELARPDTRGGCSCRDAD